MRNKRYGLSAICRILGMMTPLIMAAALSGCSTTNRLAEGELLYNGQKLDVHSPEGVEIPGELDSEITDAVNVRPNNPWPLISPYKRSPFPFGLWLYNHWNADDKGLKGWIYRKWSNPPVLVTDVRPELRVQMIEQLLENNGYFGSKASYAIEENAKNHKKATILYNVETTVPSRLDSILPIGRDSIPACRFIDSLIRLQPYLKRGEIFCVDSLKSVRIVITNRMRNRGYYYFRPEYIEFLADTLMVPGSVVLKTELAANTPDLAIRPFTTGNIYTTLQRRSKRKPGTPDTIPTKRGDLIVMRPQRVRPNMIPSCITFRKGKLFSVRSMDNTQTRLSRLGIFQSVQIQPVPIDTSPANPVMDVYINCKYDMPMEASIEVNASSKSNSYIGPGLAFNLTHHNLFGGAEKLNIKLSGSYEWQTGRERSSIFNSYEVGLSASLAFPRLLAPKFIPRTNRDINWTTLTLGGNVLNRPHYFMLADYEMGITYEWRATRNTLHQFTPLKIAYNKLIRTTHEFDSVMAMNPAVAQSFESRYIPQLSYTYTLDKWLEREHINGITFTATATEAGNLFWGIYRLCGVRGEKRLFGTPFSQFVKGQVQLVYNRRLIRGSDQWLVTRVLVGAEHAYGNSQQVPYSEQFYIGGANSIRAFTVRSLGPGSYRSPRDKVSGYFDQTGTFKLELNAEYRFPIVSILHGAVFLDAGNIWLLKDDPYRPGGKLEASHFLRDIALGTGVGLRVDLGMIVIRGDLGYGLHTPYADAQRHYFNVPFRNAFAFHLAIGYPF